MLADRQGRTIDYLRLSLTPACPMRCLYCRPQILNDTGGLPIMSAAQIESMVRHLVQQWGIYKVRLTGGEPTTRPDLREIVERLSGISGLRDLAITTNGLTLVRDIADLARAGLQRVNISLDSLRTEVFERMTGVRGLDRVVAGIHAAMEAGLRQVRLNCVVLAGENDDELGELVQFASERGLEIRFIELMPMGPLADQWTRHYVPEKLMRSRLEQIGREWQQLPQGHDSARRYRVPLTNGRVVVIGFITPMSCDFCVSCNRLRITASGEVYPCLMDQPRGNVYSAVDPEFDGAELDRRLQQALDNKAPLHPATGFTPMTILGG
ncbi:MAG: GTP 3',8-cyclase [Phycisphaerae bacterium]|nr:GTP 3',8-cyclase [Phycisphaerae bacterium]